MALLLAAFERSKFRYIPECSVEMHKQQPYVGMDVVSRGTQGAQVLKHEGLLGPTVTFQTPPDGYEKNCCYVDDSSPATPISCC